MDKKAKLIQAIKSGLVKDEKSALQFVLKEKEKEQLKQEILSEIPQPLKGEKGSDGKDADEQKIIKEVIKQIPTPKDGKDGKTPVIPINKIVATASNSVLEAIKDKIPTIHQIVQELPQEGESIRDALEMLIGEDRLDKSAIRGLDEFAKKTDIPVGGGSTARYLYQLYDIGSYVGQAGKVLSVKSDETGIEYTTNLSTDEKVKYDINDPTAGYLADKIIAGTGITLSEGTGADENKLKIAKPLYKTNNFPPSSLADILVHRVYFHLPSELFLFSDQLA